MQNFKTKHAIITSVISIVLCMAMLVGGTYAWFTDQASTKTNSIMAGTLDITLEQYDAANDKWISAENVVLDFVDKDDNKLWEPGCTYSLPKLRIANNSSLALDYEIVIDGINDATGLNRALEWTITGNGVGSLLPTDKTSGEILISAHMKEDAGNEFQGMTMDGITVTVYATQKSHESDSNDNKYDENAGSNYGKNNVGPHKLNVLSNGVAHYNEATNTYTIDVATVAQGGWNASQGKYYAGYTVSVAGYGENATIKFNKADGTEVTWKLADEERDGFINNGVHQQWTSVGLSSEYRYDIDGDGKTDFTVHNDVADAKVEVANVEQLQKAIEQENVSAILMQNIDLGDTTLVVPNDVNVVIDLNGHDITYTTPATEANYHALVVKGELNVVGNGTIALYDKSGAAFNNGIQSTPISVQGGTLTLNDGVIVVADAGDEMAYAVDVNTTLGESVLNINGAKLNSSYIGVRVFNNHSTEKGIVNYNSGIINGEKNGYDIWTQVMSKPAENAVVNIADGINYIFEDQWGGMYYIQ